MLWAVGTQYTWDSILEGGGRFALSCHVNGLVMLHGITSTGSVSLSLHPGP